MRVVGPVWFWCVMKLAGLSRTSLKLELQIIMISPKKVGHPSRGSRGALPLVVTESCGRLRRSVSSPLS